MKKLSILFSLVFFAFVISASAQTSSASSNKEKVTTEVKSDGEKGKAGCCAYSTKSCKAGSAKCCSMDKAKAEKSKSEGSGQSEAVISERKAIADAERK